MQQFELIVFDIDGTLTRSKSVIDEEMAGLICLLLAKYKVAIISGAAYSQFQWQILDHLSCPPELLKKLYLLPVDGTVMCFDEGNWRCEADEELSGKEKSEIREAFEQVWEKAGIPKPEKIDGDLVEDRGSQINFSALGQKAPIELKEKWDPDNSKRARIVEVLKSLLPNFSFHIGGTTSIEVTRPGVDKAYGLNKFSKSSGIAFDRMLYFGDRLFEGGNDAPVLTLGIECRAVKDPEETKIVIRELLV